MTDFAQRQRVTVHRAAQAVLSAPREGDSPIFSAEPVDDWARTPSVPRKLGQSPCERSWQRPLRWLCAATGAFILGLLVPAHCQAWGGAHRYIRKWAVERLPKEQAAFVGPSALPSLHEKYTSLQDTHAGGNAPHLDPYCIVPGVRLSLHDVNPPGSTRAGMEWYFERIVEQLRAGRDDAAPRDEAMKYLGVLCHWCEDPGSLSAHSSPVSEHVLRQLIPPPPEMQNRNYLFGYGWIGLEANVGLNDTDYQPQLIGGTVPD